MGLFEKAAKFFNGGPEREQIRRPGRNDLCWCGSGKKYKRCHLDEDEKTSKKYAVNCGKN